MFSLSVSLAGTVFLEKHLDEKHLKVKGMRRFSMQAEGDRDAQEQDEMRSNLSFNRLLTRALPGVELLRPESQCVMSFRRNRSCHTPGPSCMVLHPWVLPTSE